MNEKLGMIEGFAAFRARYPQAKYVAPHDRLEKPTAAYTDRLIAENATLRAEVRDLKEKLEQTQTRLRAALPKVVDVEGTVSIKDVQHAFCTVYSAMRASVDMEPYAIGWLKCLERNKQMSHPRQVCMYIARHVCIPSPSTTRLGMAFGGRDHSTVLWALNQARIHMANDPLLKAAHDDVVARFKAQQ